MTSPIPNPFSDLITKCKYSIIAKGIASSYANLLRQKVFALKENRTGLGLNMTVVT